MSVGTTIRAFSWTIEDGSNAFKQLDKSAFIYGVTGIPKEIRSFFLKNELALGENFPVKLMYQGRSFAAHIGKERKDSARTRLFWSSDFTTLIKDTFPYHYQSYSIGEEPTTEVVLRLKRLKNHESYEVTFAGDISEKSIERDINSEQIEEFGPQKEGGSKEYYGKRYERSSANRQQAIKLHGLSCNACGFNFERTYGERGVGFIEVHHIKPIHTYEKEQQVNPETDLITLCSNCHRMIHRDPNNILSVEDIRKIISEWRNASRGKRA